MDEVKIKREEDALPRYLSSSLCASHQIQQDITKAIEKAHEIQDNAQAASKTQRLKSERFGHWESPATIAVCLGYVYRDGARKMVIDLSTTSAYTLKPLLISTDSTGKTSKAIPGK